MRQELPFGLMYVMAQDKRAMQHFARMNEQEKNGIIEKARGAMSEAELKLIVMSLSDGTSAVENS